MINRNSWRSFFRYTLPVIFISLAFHFPIFLEAECQNENSTFVNITKEETEIDAYNFWYKDIARMIVLGAIPFFILSFLNVKIFLSIRKLRRQTGLEIGSRFATKNKRMELELEQARRSTLIASVYFFFLLLYIAKKLLYMFVNKDNHLPLKCMVDPPTLFQRLAKPTQCFLFDLISTINFFIFIYTGSKFRKILLKNFHTFVNFFKCSNTSTSSELGVPQIQLESLSNYQIQTNDN